MSDQMEFELDPRKVLDGVNQMSAGVKKLADDMEEALGKNASKSVKKLEDAAQNGSNKIITMFRNLGTRVKEDLKTAFDVGMVLEGAKFAKDISAGTKQVFEMERAFDRLNTRLQMTGRELSNFKKSVGQAVSGTGQKLEDILPGVENAASKGGVKSPAQLTQIAQSLGQAKGITGEDVGGLSDTVIEILKTQGKAVNAKSFKETLDAIEGSRTAGAFGSANEAGGAIEQLSPFAKKLGLNTRQLGGLAAGASRSGASGQDILRQLLEKGTSIGGQEQLNAAFGTKLFKGGKLDPSAFQNIKKDQFGKYSQQVMGEVSGMTGANGADLSRFLDSMKGSMEDMKKVTGGANETADQFSQATDNFASKFDKFKEKTKEAGREVGSSLSAAANEILKGNFQKSMGHVSEAGGAAFDNKGTIMGALGLTAAVGAVAGGSMKNLLGKIGGGAAGNLLGGIATGEAAKMAGATPVYVVNAAEIAGGGSGAGDIMKKLGGGAAAAGGIGAGSIIAATAGVALAAVGVGGLLGEMSKKSIDSNPAIKMDDRGNFTSNMMSREEVAAMKKAHTEAILEANDKMGTKKTYTNPASVKGTGGSM